MTQTSQMTQEYALSLFEYIDGKLFWKVNRKRAIKGNEAGCIKGKGYKYVCVDGVSHRVHRLIFLMHHGYTPPIIDHEDDNRLNNRIENLQELSNSENTKKIPIRLYKHGDKWTVFLTKHYGHKRLGEYDSAEEACEAKARFKLELNIP